MSDNRKFDPKVLREKYEEFKFHWDLGEEQGFSISLRKCSHGITQPLSIYVPGLDDLGLNITKTETY